MILLVFGSGYYSTSKNGYKQENIFILRGGWYKWLELGYPVEKGKSLKGAFP